MGYSVTYNDPTGTTGVKRVDVDATSFTIEPSSRLIMYKGEATVAAFVNWYAVFPDDSDEATNNPGPSAP